MYIVRSITTFCYKHTMLENQVTFKGHSQYRDSRALVRVILIANKMYNYLASSPGSSKSSEHIMFRSLLGPNRWSCRAPSELKAVHTSRLSSTLGKQEMIPPGHPPCHVRQEASAVRGPRAIHGSPSSSPPCTFAGTLTLQILDCVQDLRPLSCPILSNNKVSSAVHFTAHRAPLIQDCDPVPASN